MEGLQSSLGNMSRMVCFLFSVKDIEWFVVGIVGMLFFHFLERLDL